jgi:protein-disulfide isomerase
MNGRWSERVPSCPGTRAELVVYGAAMNSHRKSAAATMVALALLGLVSGVTHAQTSKLLERAAASRAKGERSAPVMVYEIADFQCPHCARFARDVFPKIDSAFVKTGKVQWFFVNLPQPIHGNAWPATEAALCAGATADRFWVMHDRLFATQSEWATATDAALFFARLAKEAGAAGDAFQDCVSGDRLAALIMQDVIFAVNTKVSGTPAFIINDGQMIVGVKTFEEWTELLEQALKKPKTP